MVPVTLGRWRPHTTGILVGGLVLVLVALVALYMLNNFRPTTDVKISASVFKARLATTESERAQGLSGVEKLGANEALLMVYDSDSKWGIWMNNMKIPLDIVWLDSDKEVVYIVTDASPELGTTKTFKPKDAARYVLELPAGTVKKSAIKIGDEAAFTLKDKQ